MTDPVPLPRLLEWMEEGTALLTRHVGKLAEERLGEPSTLSGWTFGHLLTHVARNADALTNLATWAATGVETPMYPGGPDQRLADIQTGATRPPAQILDDVTSSADRLAHRLADLSEEAWTNEVRTAQGRTISACQIPWLRIREVWIHAVDLGTGARLADFPSDLAVTLLEDVLVALSGREGCPALTVRVTPTGPVLTTHADKAGTEISGTAAALLGWLTGRTAGAGLTPNSTRLPALPAWL